MTTNLLKALLCLSKSKNNNLREIYSGTANRINMMGDALDFYIKDLFCGSFMKEGVKEKKAVYEQYFSYLGSPTKPPDAIIRGGDAIEVKKIENLRAGIALNSSYPKSKLYSNSPMIAKKCRDCEEWDSKDLVYVIGVVEGERVKLLWFVYGDCYAADKEVYENVRNTIIQGVEAIPDVELADTDELGRVNRVDPLGITYLRVRGMWGIQNPIDVFTDIISYDESDNFVAYTIISDSKFALFPEADRNAIVKNEHKNIILKDVEIRSPNDAAEFLSAKLITIKF